MRRPTQLFLFATLAFLFVSNLGLAQQVATASDAMAIQIARSFVLQNSGTVAVTSYSASGTASRFSAGAEESAPVTLQSLGGNQSRLGAQFSSGTTTEVRGLNTQSSPIGYWINESGTHSVPFQNVYQGTNWFFPLLSSLGQFADTTLVFKYLGQEDWNGVNVLHVQVLRQLSPSTKKAPAITVETEYYVDPQTYLLWGMAGAYTQMTEVPPRLLGKYTTRNTRSKAG